MALPDFLVIGAPKAGSTALHAALAQHPALHMSPVKEPKFFLSDGPPPARGGPGDAQTYREHVWRRPDYEALFDGAPAGGAARRVHPAVPARPGRAPPHPRADPAGQADRRAAGSGRAGALQLDAPVVGRARADRGLRPRLRGGAAPDRGGLGQLLALHQPRPVRRAAGAPVPPVPPRAGAGAALPLAGRQPGGDARPDLRLPRRRAGDHRQPAPGERDRASRGDASPPRGGQGGAGRRRRGPVPARHRRGGAEQAARARAAAQRAPAPAAHLGRA